MRINEIGHNFLRIGLLITIVVMSGCATNVVVKEKELKSEEIQTSFDEYTIVFVSDLHINKLLKEKYYKKVAKLIEEENPDLLLLGGDYIDEDTENIDRAFEILDEIIKVQAIAVLGNHDNWVSKVNIKNRLEKLGIIVLENNNIKIEINNEYINVAGLADDYSDQINIEKALFGIEKKEFTILLSHSPEPYKKIKDDQRVDLMLSGHTHGGQITIFGIWTPILPLRDKTYWRGEYLSDNNRLLITNGIGVFRYPIRLFAQPRIEKIILKRTI